MQVSVDGLLCCTISNDDSVKVYDVVNYDMMVMIRLPFVPGAVEWVSKQGDVKARLAISDRNSSFVHVYDARAGSNEPIISREVSQLPHFLKISLFPLLLFALTMINIFTWLLFSFSFLSLIYPDPLGPNKSYEVQSCFWLCDICRCQWNHWVLEPYYTSVPREWVCSQTHICIYFICKHFLYMHRITRRKATSTLQKNRKRIKKKKDRKEKEKGKTQIPGIFYMDRH